MHPIPDINAVKPLLTKWRRYLHQHPETAFEEVQTARFVAQKLNEFGLEVHERLAETGVVGVLSRGRGGGTIGLRADMDALPMQEENRFPHVSRHPGKMHACGHDGHVTMLLAAARYLAEQGRFDGTVVFIFQPAEENEGGGRRMVDEGLFEQFPVEAVYGLHNFPTLELGTAATRVGTIMASFDTFDLEIKGKGTHSAMPHHGIDPILAAAEVVSSLHGNIHRKVDPLEPSVLGITQINAGSTYNVIPARARLSGSIRTTSPEARAQIETHFKQIVGNVCEAHGAGADITYERRYPPTVNRAQETERAVAAAAAVLGVAKVETDCRPVMGSEDFAWMLRAKPGAYILLGSGGKDGDDKMPHNPNYDFNDALLPIGASYWVRLVEHCLVRPE